MNYYIYSLQHYFEILYGILSNKIKTYICKRVNEHHQLAFYKDINN